LDQLPISLVGHPAKRSRQTDGSRLTMYPHAALYMIISPEH